MFKDLPKKRRWQIYGLCAINVTFGLLIGLTWRYAYPSHLERLRVQAWNDMAKYEDSIVRVMRLGALPEIDDILVKKVFLLVEAEILIKESESGPKSFFPWH